jgi:hypothetical protein
MLSERGEATKMFKWMERKTNILGSLATTYGAIDGRITSDAPNFWYATTVIVSD